MTLEHYYRLYQIQYALSGIAVVLSFIFFRKRSQTSILIGLSFSLTILVYLAGDLLSLKGKSMNIPSSIYSILNLPVISCLYFYALNKKYAHTFVVASLFHLVFGIYNLLFLQKEEFNSYTNVVSSLIIIFYSTYYYYHLLIDLPVTQIHRLPMFWFNAGLLIFSAGTFFLFLFTSYLVEVLHDNLLLYYCFHNILSIIEILIIFIGLAMDLRNVKLQKA